ncbi:heterokaryon incompatibility protein-domain-containing protein [Microdochium trichocladiopsis]|uniref:Heterokaryon incompatibility protein-domain-containing protein n=1 Tax=Microdochium trichocladiopsis TaxID=1682393 RepID=A0A9P8Y1Y5_9PEZI|nr:heterokaryon incompatibility protein-domain-containing protein [Microdochium trichocladiopsis]KAH7025687.1 heterokaryon incompatibility protein-domain-containing protein [Microdochium trichocladiopsis]
MRLLNAKSHKFEEFYDDETPQYAILSHTWQRKQEVTYQEWLNPTVEVRARSGFRKICQACEQALRNNHEWIWIDTNCIDKSSSAELSEAINSMYAWYRDAAVCYVYLEDVPPALVQDDVLLRFRESRWWARGWTLQELLAPEQLVFFALDWSSIGDRGELASEIEHITGIRARDCKSEVRTASVARKMSWLSQRQTTRVEDLAYCMLGIFDINMPLLYGEGSKAFIRLQEEIIKKYADLTIFCWTRDESTLPDWLGMLAHSPRAFAQSGGFHLSRSVRLITPWSITNQGLSISLPVIHTFKGAFLYLYGVNIVSTGVPYHVVAIPISAHDQVCYRLTLPRGPIALTEAPFDKVFPVSERALPRLLLLPTRDSSLPVSDGLQSTKQLKDTSTPSTASVLLLIDANAPGFFPMHVASHDDQRHRLLDQGLSKLGDCICAPSGCSADLTTGLVKLSEVVVGQRCLLAGALELFSVSGGLGEIKIRLFLAFERPSAGDLEVTEHYCDTTAFTIPSPSGNLQQEKAPAWNTAALERWYFEKLDDLRTGNTAQKPGFFWSTDGWCQLKILSDLAQTTDQALITVVLAGGNPFLYAD